MISSSHLFLGLPCLMVPETISIRLRLGRRMLLILQTWPNQDSCDSVMRARLLLGLTLQEEIIKRTSSFSLGSRHEAFLSQNIRTCMCSITFNPAFHQNSKVFKYNLALPLIYCWPTRLGKLLIRLKPQAIQSNGNVLWNTLQPIGAKSVMVTDSWKIPFNKRYCFMNFSSLEWYCLIIWISNTL